MIKNILFLVFCFSVGAGIFSASSYAAVKDHEAVDIGGPVAMDEEPDVVDEEMAERPDERIILPLAMDEGPEVVDADEAAGNEDPIAQKLARHAPLAMYEENDPSASYRKIYYLYKGRWKHDECDGTAGFDYCYFKVVSQEVDKETGHATWRQEERTLGFYDGPSLWDLVWGQNHYGSTYNGIYKNIFPRKRYA